MPTKILETLNTTVIGTMSAADLVLPDRVFVAVNIPRNDFGAVITGIAYSVEANILDVGSTPLVVCSLVEGLTLRAEIDTNIQLKIPALGSSSVDSPYRRRYHRTSFSFTADVNDDFNTPIEIISGVPFTAFMLLDQHTGAAYANSVAFILTVRGYLKTENHKQVKSFYSDPR